MKEKFILRHIGNTKGESLTFIPFYEGERKAKITAVKIRNFFSNHVSSTQYDAIIREFIQDMEIIETISKDKRIIVKRDRIW